MLNIGRLAAGGEGYYLDSVATGVEDYYTGSGEAPGYWLTEAAAELGLTGRVDPPELRSIMAGRDPARDESLLRTSRRRVPGFDLAFRAPKSVSLLWALGDETTTAVVRDAHDQAVQAAIRYLEEFAACSRRGRARERMKVDGLVAAAFRHRTSRAGDPLLHTHVLVANLARCSDGEWRTLDSPVLHVHAKTAGFLYQAALREQLSRRLGVEWTEVTNGTAEIVGVPREVIRAFSRRRAQIEARMAEVGARSAKGAQAATLATRQAKSDLDAARLVDVWRARAAELGFSQADVTARLGVAAHEPPAAEALLAAGERLAGPQGLTAKASTFTRRDVIQAWCAELRGGADVEEVLRLADATLDPQAGLTVQLLTAQTAATEGPTAAVVEQVVSALTSHLTEPEAAALRSSADLREALAAVITSGWSAAQTSAALLERELASAEEPDAVLAWRAQRLARQVAGHIAAGSERGAVIRRADGRAIRADRVERRYSTPELLALEQRLIDQAERRRGAGVATVPASAVARALARRPSISQEQAAMVRRLLTSGDGVEVVVGKAGAGKTYALDAARDAWQATGAPVVGAALAARAAAELEAGAGIDSYTVDALLADLDRPGGGLASGTVVVIDEAAMVGTRKLARLLDHVERARGKAVLVGDHRQLPEIDAGGAFRGLLHRLDPVQLQDNRRQRHEWERAALDELREGDPAVAIGAYGERGQLVVGATADAVREQLVDDWWAAYRQDGPGGGVMIAARRSDAEDLNGRARIRLAESGVLTGASLVVEEREFRIGDRVVALHNDRKLGVLNGTRATVVAVDLEGNALRVLTDDGDERYLPTAYLEAGHLTHAYALTGHKAQGLTAERAWVLGSDEIYREWGYVALSRGREANRLYVVAAEQPPGADEHCHAPAPDGDRVTELVRALERSRGQALATDQSAEEPSAGPSQRGCLAELLSSAPDDPARQLQWVAEERDAAEGQLRAAREREAAEDVERWHARLADIEQRARVLTDAAEQRRAWVDEHDSDLATAAALVDQDGLDAHRRAQAAEFHPPSYLTNAIGPRPDDPAARRAWRSAALAIEVHRTRYAIEDPDGTLGERPPSGRERLDHDRVTDAVKAVSAARDVALTHRSPQPELELGQDLA